MVSDFADLKSLLRKGDVKELIIIHFMNLISGEVQNINNTLSRGM